MSAENKKGEPQIFVQRLQLPNESSSERLQIIAKNKFGDLDSIIFRSKEHAIKELEENKRIGKMFVWVMSGVSITTLVATLAVGINALNNIGNEAEIITSGVAATFTGLIFISSGASARLTSLRLKESDKVIQTVRNFAD